MSNSVQQYRNSKFLSFFFLKALAITWENFESFQERFELHHLGNVPLVVVWLS